MKATQFKIHKQNSLWFIQEYVHMLSYIRCGADDVDHHINSISLIRDFKEILCVVCSYLSCYIGEQLAMSKRYRRIGIQFI